jgi:hypothetical protein
MKILAASMLFAVLYPTAPNPPVDAYPVHFHMVYVRRFMRQNSNHGSGIANISEAGRPTRGFQFSFDSCADFNGRFPHEMPARWLGDHHLQLAVERIDLGPDTKEECILNGRLQDFKYEKVDGKPSEVPLSPPQPPPATPPS